MDVDDDLGGSMAGLVDAEVVVDDAMHVRDSNALCRQHLDRMIASSLRGSGVLASSTPANAEPLSDYAPDFLINLHVTTFPWGKGARPAGMSLPTYAAILLQRVPNKQHANNVNLLFDLHNMHMRHEVNTHTAVQARGNAALFKKLERITVKDLNTASMALSQRVCSVRVHESVSRILQ